MTATSVMSRDTPVSRTALRQSLFQFATVHRSELIFVLLASLIRIFAVSVSPAGHLEFLDAVRFARTDMWRGVFSDYWMPGGYAGFLAAARLISNVMWFTILLQHVLGVTTAVILARTALRAGVRQPWHLVGGAFVAFGGDYIFFEHTLMSESFLLFVLAIAVYAGFRVAVDFDPRWCIVAGISLAVAALVRGNTVVLLPIFALALLPALRMGFRRWIIAVAAFVGPPLVILGAYVGTAREVGPYTGFSEMTGWLLYSRAAPFADCTKMKVDDDNPTLAELCESTPPSQRLGPYYYTWDASSPARRLWDEDPKHNQQLLSFAEDAILRQKGDYIRAVAEDMVRLVDPVFRARPGSGQNPAAYSFRYRTPGVADAVKAALKERYRGLDTGDRRGYGLLANYQDVTGAPAITTPVALALIVFGVVRRRGSLRRQIVLTLLVATILLVVPIALLTWDLRYQLPAEPFLVLGALCAVGPYRRADGMEASPEATIG